eukprot:g31755.t1
MHPKDAKAQKSGGSVTLVVVLLLVFLAILGAGLLFYRLFRRDQRLMQDIGEPRQVRFYSMQKPKNWAQDEMRISST